MNDMKNMLLLTNFDQNFIRFPVYVQEKLDGVRCLIRNGKAYTRNGNEIKNIHHILDETPFPFDGELYCENLKFSEIAGLIRIKNLTKKDKEKLFQIKLHVFDLKVSGSFSERLQKLQEIFHNNKFNHVCFVSTFLCNTLPETLEKAKEFISCGKEGAVFRNASGMYVSGRSKNVQKFKVAYDTEFQIVGFKESDNEPGTVVWKCITDRRVHFYVRPKGTLSERKIAFDDANQHVGKWLTVQFKELDTETGVPREPVGLRIISEKIEF